MFVSRSVFRCGCVLAFFVLALSISGNAQTQRDFPSDDDVGLLLTQAERAIERYKPLIDEQEMEIGKSAADDVAGDRKQVTSLEATLKKLEAKHEMFNGSLGFSFFAGLANADRNALRCGFAASSQSTGYVIAGDREKADALLHLSQKCMDVSMLIFTISENASSLYKQFIVAEDQWAAHSTQEARECENTLDKNRPKKFEPVF